MKILFKAKYGMKLDISKLFRLYDILPRIKK